MLRCLQSVEPHKMHGHACRTTGSNAIKMSCESAPTEMGFLTTHSSVLSNPMMIDSTDNRLSILSEITRSSEVHTNSPDIANLMRETPPKPSPVRLQNSFKSSIGSSSGHPLATSLLKTDDPCTHTSRSASSINL